MAKGMTAKRVGQACLHTLRWTVVMLRNGRLPAGAGALVLGAILTYVVTDARFSVDTVVVTGVGQFGTHGPQQPGLLAHLAPRALQRRLTALQLALRQRLVVVPRPLDQPDPHERSTASSPIDAHCTTHQPSHSTLPTRRALRFELAG